MASTAIGKDEDKLEYFDSPEVLEQKISEFAEMVQYSAYMVAFTGAGISTSAGIPDYRSGANTVIGTGPGCWETAANIKAAKAAGKDITQIPKSKFNTTIQRARPAYIHLAMAKLMEQGILKHVISQNVDGLHRKSGIPASGITELHGNTNLEICTKCGKNYMRDFQVREVNGNHDHKTSRFCDDPKCKAQLKDSIINFGEGLEPNILQQGFDESQKADLHVCLGSSMRVQPAASMPVITPMMGGKLVVINLQKTPINPVADIVIHAKIEDVMQKLMSKLKIQVPKFKRNLYAKVQLAKGKGNGLEYLNITGCDEVGDPYAIFRSVAINGEETNQCPLKADEKKADSVYLVDFTFQGFYNEPKLKLSIPRRLMTPENQHTIKLKLVFDTESSNWESVVACMLKDKTELEQLEFKTEGAPVDEKDEEEKKEGELGEKHDLKVGGGIGSGFGIKEKASKKLV